MGVLTTIDRAALAAYCQSYARWVEAEQKLKETPALLKTPSGYVQQSPWLGIANKQLELMGRYMTELGMTPASRSRVARTTRACRCRTIDLPHDLRGEARGRASRRRSTPSRAGWSDGNEPARCWQDGARRSLRRPRSGCRAARRT